MTIRLYDTATRAVRDLDPVRAGHVGIYHCGLTVQGPPHVGHIRKEVVFDVLRRWLEHSGYQVTLVANITDIDDKILAKSAAAGVEWWAHAYANERALHDAYAVLGCLPPTYEPRATGHIPEMLELIDTLIDKGHAYAAIDGTGDVYFDVRSWPAYGELSRQHLDDMEAAADADPRGKRDQRDFALWKGAKPDEPATASWPSPWGRGRPGWHLECSAMAGKYLGEDFDVHGGGLDLRFPHHENELAQSTAAGHRFARTWMHNGLVTTAGEKMSKSLGNSALVSEVVQRFRAVELRYYLVAPHYRSVVEFSDDALTEAAAAYGRLEGFVRRASDVVGPVDADTGMPCADFIAAMDDDLGTPAALAAVHEVVREGNRLLADAGPAGDPAATKALRGTLTSVRRMLAVLGLDPLDPVWATGGGAGDSETAIALDTLVRSVLAERQEARARKDWPAADAARDRLRRAGVEIEDTPSGARWSTTQADG
ncbi:cysteine--tRNA ligase [soil metagenome]